MNYTITQDALGTHIDWQHDAVTAKMIDWFWSNMEKAFLLWHPEEHEPLTWVIPPKVAGLGFGPESLANPDPLGYRLHQWQKSDEGMRASSANHRHLAGAKKKRPQMAWFGPNMPQSRLVIGVCFCRVCISFIESSPTPSSIPSQP